MLQFFNYLHKISSRNSKLYTFRNQNLFGIICTSIICTIYLELSTCLQKYFLQLEHNIGKQQVHQ